MRCAGRGTCRAERARRPRPAAGTPQTVVEGLAKEGFGSLDPSELGGGGFGRTPRGGGGYPRGVTDLRKEARAGSWREPLPTRGWGEDGPKASDKRLQPDIRNPPIFGLENIFLCVGMMVSF